MDATFVVLSIGLGLVTSLAGGFWGIGCGWLVVPSLLLFPGEITIPVAVAASMMQLIPSSAYTVSRQFKHIGWEKGGWGRRIALPICLFSFLGGFLGRSAGDWLESVASSRLPHKLVYVGLLLFVLYKTLAGAAATASCGSSKSSVNAVTVSVIGFFLGIIAAFLGCGGGTLNRPIMRTVLKVPEEKTGQILRLGVFLTALSGSIGYGINNPDIEQILSIAGLISIGGMVGFPIGAKLHGIVVKAGDEALADRSFSIVVGIVLASLIFKLTALDILGQIALLATSFFLVVYLAVVGLCSSRKLRTSPVYA